MSSVFDIPRYNDNPIYLFFESYIIRQMGKMSDERFDHLQRMSIHQIFGSDQKDWCRVVEEVLGLSETIRVAILDLWLQNREHYFENEEGYLAFAQDFTDNYMLENSKIDVWTEESLLSAKERVQMSEYADQ